MDMLLRLARWIDALNDRFASLAKWAVLGSCFISAANALVRYLLNYSSNSWLKESEVRQDSIRDELE